METGRINVVRRWLKTSPRTCVSCGREFPGWGRQRFCGKPCQRKWDYQQHAEARRANRRNYYLRQKERQSVAAAGAS